MMTICRAPKSLSVGCNNETNQLKSPSGFIKIKQWQKHIQKEGWSAEIVDEILNQSRRFSRYEMEFDDDWLTPGDFVRAGFKGDCEDIAIFMMGSLKLFTMRRTRIRISH